jgi:uncharacterized caspase-like protein
MTRRAESPEASHHRFCEARLLALMRRALVVLALLAVGCVAGTATDSSEPPPIPATATADDLLVVDCLLPGQIRKLGGQITYVTPRRPVKTSALDCEIRGGEYVAYDRANYATALSVWLPAAEEGDAHAQNFVGEIFERGLGRAPEYDVAAGWYLRAAKQDFAPAQINLGQLHERGLGVEMSAEEALVWYRRAAGLEDAEWELAPAPGPELAALRQQLEHSTQEAEQLRGELTRVRRDLSHARQQRAEREADAASAREALAAKQREIAEERRRMAFEAERIQAAAAGVEQRRTQAASSGPDPAEVEARAAALLERESELARRADALSKGEAELARQIEQLERSQARTESSQSVLETARADLAERQSELQAESVRLEREQSDAARERGEIDALQLTREALDDYAASLASRESALGQRSRDVEARARDLAAAESALREKREGIARMGAEIEQLRREAEAQREQLAELARSQPVVVAGPAIQMLDPLIVAARDTASRGSVTHRVRTAAGVSERTIVGRIDAPAGLLSLTINDLTTPSDEQGMFTRNLPIVQEGTRVEIVAVDRQGSRADLRLTLLPEDPATATAETSEEPASAVPAGIEFGRYFALVIGNDDYPNLTKLMTAVADAKAVSEVLEQRYGFEVTQLLDATRYEILSALNRLTSRLTKEDNLLVYYAGHGELDRVNQVGHWLPVDAEPDNPANWLSTRSLTDELNRMKAKHVLVVADSCYSGALTRVGVTQLRTGETASERLGWIRAQLGLRVRMAMTSGGLEPVIDFGGGGNSVFARYFIDVLRANDGVLDGMSLYQAIAAKVVEAARKHDFDQVPEYAPIRYGHHENGHFLFVPRV